MAYDKSDETGSTAPDRNPDPITGSPGSHPLGTGIGAGSGAATGAAVGAIGGPIGAVIGGVAGAVVGAFAGHAAGEANDPTEDWTKTGKDDPYWKGKYETTDYHKSDVDYDHVEPAYDYGSRIATTQSPVVDEMDGEEIDRTGTGTGLDTDASRRPALADPATARDFAEFDSHARTHWEKAKGESNLSYDEARPAIREAYDRTLKLHEERLKVGKDRVQTGNVGVHKEIVTENRTINVPVEHEEVVITTTKLTGDADGGTIDDGEEIRVPVSEERVHVEKEVVPTAEVHLNRKTVQDTQQVVDSIRKEKVKVERDGDVKVTDDSESQVSR